MHIAYSALSQSKETAATAAENQNEILTRYDAYITTCQKYSREIKEIQQYLPGWIPKFHY